MNLTKAQLQFQKLQRRREYRAVIQHVADQIYRRTAVKTATTTNNERTTTDESGTVHTTQAG